MSTHANSQQAEQTHADTCTLNIRRQTSTTCRQIVTVLTQASLRYTWRHFLTHTHTHALPRLCESVDICICQGSYSSLFSAPNVSEGNQIILTHKPATSLLQIKRHTHTHTHAHKHSLIHTPRSLDSRGSIWQLVQWSLKARSANRQQFALIETRKVGVRIFFFLVKMQTAFSF